MRLTQRAFLLGAVAGCFYLVSVANSLPSFYYVLVWLAVGLLAASLGIALLSLTGTTCSLRERRVSGYARSQVGEGETPPLWEADLGNAGSLNKTGLQLELYLLRRGDDGRAKGKPVPTLARFLIEALPAGSSLHAPLPLDFLPRGVYSLQNARLIGSDILGLFHAAKRLSVPPTALQVVVAPAVLQVAMRREWARGSGGRDGSRVMTRLGAGENLRGVRSYVPGDDWRHIHWATTARTGQLAVREFERSGSEAVLVVWDGVLATTSTHAGVTTEEELCLVTSLLCAIDAGRTPVSVAVLGGENELVPANGSEGLLSREALDLLARATPKRTTPLSSALMRAQKGDEGSFGQVFFVSSSPGADLESCVSASVGRGEMPVVALCEAVRPPIPARHGALKSVRVLETSSPQEAQERALRAVGARVVRVSLSSAEPSIATLERALVEMLEPSL